MKRQGGFETAKPSLCLWESQLTNHFKPQTEISKRTDGREESGQHEPPSISRQNEGRQHERRNLVARAEAGVPGLGGKTGELGVGHMDERLVVTTLEIDLRLLLDAVVHEQI
jgi:hypothetical protein